MRSNHMPPSEIFKLVNLLSVMEGPQVYYTQEGLASILSKMGNIPIGVLSTLIERAKVDPLTPVLVETGPVAALIRILDVHSGAGVNHDMKKLVRVIMLNFFATSGYENDSALIALSNGLEKLGTREILSLFCLFIVAVRPEKTQEILDLEIGHYVC